MVSNVAPHISARRDCSGTLRPIVTAAAVLIIVGLLPFFAKGFWLFQITMALIYALAILGLILLTGLSGQISLGHGAFYAIGAYTAAILIEHAGIGYYWALPAAGAMCFIAGFLFGLPALRLEGPYLALATFALAIAAPQLLKWKLLAPWTGGVQGLVVSTPAAPFGLPISSDHWLYVVTMGCLLFLYCCTLNLTKSRSGRALIAIRENPVSAQAMGINIALYKSLTFGLSALYAGIAGALSAMTMQFVAPDSFTVAFSIALFAGFVVGSVSPRYGPFFGGAFILIVPNLADHVSKGLTGAIYSVVLILVISVPAGLTGMNLKRPSRHNNENPRRKP